MKNDLEAIIFGFMIGAFGYMIADSLNHTLQLTFNHYIDGTHNVILANAIYTTLVIIFSITVATFLHRYLLKNNEIPF